jgi:glycolate oxidase iron-sulfur subunit
LLDIGRGIVEQQQRRPLQERLLRWGLRQLLPYSTRFTVALRIGQFFRPILPNFLRVKIPPRQRASSWPISNHDRVMVALAGCAQPGTTPNTNTSAARVLDKLGITLNETPESGCCGAVSYHMAEHDEGLDFARRNIDAWWPAIENGAEAIVVTASGCGTMVKDYGKLLDHDTVYAEKARKVSELAMDLSEVVYEEDLDRLKIRASEEDIAVHCPCSLQHGQQKPDIIESILENAGFRLTQTKDKHLCCGSAGTYSIMQPEISERLRTNKLKALTVNDPNTIVTANIGCQLHLGAQSYVPVKHWIEIVDEASM